ncbi:hypothetical protein CLV62_12026 [Dysgonomonas alginatilytica]|uniref:Uncharacterized protein n=1 Tax=Dysgonomonas alginatilytica TaxID=1605892 RepID=A0A2V3PNH9_9BACT|nr:hypothetical protein [Dysgonomonas alginatilytica]PXV62338.1 hypothetical protein CLV62_12026 [Dysgonomonas alginatilytica]
MENTNNSGDVNPTLLKIIEACNNYGESLEGSGDSILLVASIKAGDHTKAAISIAGEPSRTSVSIYKAMMQETGIAKIILNASRLFLQDGIGNRKPNILSLLFSELLGEKDDCNCENCVERRAEMRRGN